MGVPEESSRYPASHIDIYSHFTYSHLFPTRPGQIGPPHWKRAERLVRILPKFISPSRLLSLKVVLCIKDNGLSV